MFRRIHFSLKSLPAMMIVAGCASLAAQTSNAGATWPDLMIHLHGSGKAFLVDPATDKTVATIETAKGGTLGTTTPDGRKVYVGAAAPDARTVTVIDLKSRKRVTQLDTGARPKHPLASPDGRLVGVNHWGLDDGKLRVTFIDAKTDKIAKMVDIGVSGEAKGPTSMHNSWSPDSRYFYNVDRVDNQLVVIDTNDWSVREFDVSSKPHYPVPSPDGSELWLVLEGVDRDNPPQVVVYDTASMKVKTTLKMPLIGEQVVQGHHGNFTQDGKHFMILNRGGKDKLGREVAVFDAKTKELVKRFTTASNGIGHAYNSPDGHYTMITNYGNNVVSIVDVATMTPVKDLAMGAGRMGHVAYTPDGRYGYVSNNGDGNLWKVDMKKLAVVGEVVTGNAKGGGQVLNVWTNVFEELPR